jgi:hypothetical protein
VALPLLVFAVWLALSPAARADEPARPEPAVPRDFYDAVRGDAPPSHSYVESAASRARREELERLDARIAVLAQRRHDHALPLPIGLLAAGVLIGTSSSLVALVVDYETHDADGPALAVYGVMGSTGLVLAVTGFVMLIHRIKARAATRPELRALTRRRRCLLDASRCDVALSTSASRTTLALTWRF